MWVPLADEPAAVSGLPVRGWAVSPGERYRFRSAPGELRRGGAGTYAG